MQAHAGGHALGAEASGEELREEEGGHRAHSQGKGCHVAATRKDLGVGPKA